MGYSKNETVYVFSTGPVCPDDNIPASAVGTVAHKFLCLVVILANGGVGRMAGAGGYAKRFLSAQPVLQNDHAGGDFEHGVFVVIFSHSHNR